MDYPQFQCFRRIGKAEFWGSLTIETNALNFSCPSDPSANGLFPFSVYVAQRQHPKLPMVQLRFALSGRPPEDVTFVFKDVQTQIPIFDLLQSFLLSFNNHFQSLRIVPTEEISSSLPHSSETQVLRSAAAAAHLQNGQQAQPVQPVAQSDAATPLPPPPRISSVRKPARPRGLSSADMAASQRLQEERQRVLEDDADVATAYEYLVGNNYLTESQFWEQHDMEFLGGQSQPVGKESDESFLSLPPQPTAPSATTTTTPIGGKDKPRHKLPKITDQQLEQILSEHPPIKQCYLEYVPAKIAMTEFWSRFFQSRYFYQMTGRPIPLGADESLFPEFNPEALLPMPSAPEVQGMVDSSVDLIAADQFNKPGFGSSLGFSSLVGDWSRAPDRSTKKGLLERFNRHSVGIMQSIEANTKMYGLNGGSRKESDFYEKRRRILLEDTAMEDLKTQDRPSIPLLEMRKKEIKFAEFTSTDKLKAEQARDSICLRLENCVPGQLKELPPEEGKAMFLLNTRLIQRELQTQDTNKVQELASSNEIKELMNRVANHQNRLRQLFYHFWQTQIHQKEKQDDLAKAIKSTQEEILRSITQLQTTKQTSTVNIRALYQPLIEATKTALDRYEALKVSKQKTLSKKQDIG